MNSSRTPKVVVGIGLVAAYAGGLAAITLSSMQDSNARQNIPVAAAPAVAVPSALPSVAAAEADPVTAAPAPVAAATRAPLAKLNGEAGTATARPIQPSPPNEPTQNLEPTVASIAARGNNGPAATETDTSNAENQIVVEPDADSSESIELDAEVSAADGGESEDDPSVQLIN